MTKKEFAWDKEIVINEIKVNEYEKRIVSMAELNGKQFMCVATHKKIKNEWKPVKNATFPVDVWKQVVEAVNDFEIENAFSSKSKVKVTKKTTKKKSEEPTLKGKKTATKTTTKTKSKAKKVTE